MLVKKLHILIYIFFVYSDKIRCCVKFKRFIQNIYAMSSSMMQIRCTSVNIYKMEFYFNDSIKAFSTLNQVYNFSSKMGDIDITIWEEK